MKKIFIPLFVLFLCLPANANEYFLPENKTFMGEYKNQMGFGLGQGFDTGWILPPPTRPVPFYIETITYSQPTTFFRVSARRSINISETLGLDEKYGWKWQDYTIPIIYLTEDILLVDCNDFYVATGAGLGLQAQENERLGAKLIFQFKITFGYHINERWSTEFFVQHFSNANTADENHSYAFYGLGFTYNY